jgi:hypothetical protein
MGVDHEGHRRRAAKVVTWPRAVGLVVLAWAAFFAISAGATPGGGTFSAPSSLDFADTSFGSATGAQIVFTNDGSAPAAAPTMSTLDTHGKGAAFGALHDLDGPDSCAQRTVVPVGSYCVIWLSFEPPSAQTRAYTGVACFAAPDGGLCTRLQGKVKG